MAYHEARKYCIRFFVCVVDSASVLPDVMIKFHNDDANMLSSNNQDAAKW